MLYHSSIVFKNTSFLRPSHYLPIVMVLAAVSLTSFCTIFLSWDRWVVEDQVLRDSENNRSLMARLHEQALK